MVYVYAIYKLLLGPGKQSKDLEKTVFPVDLWPEGSQDGEIKLESITHSVSGGQWRWELCVALAWAGFG